MKSIDNTVNKSICQKWVIAINTVICVLSLSCALRINRKECPGSETEWKSESKLFECKSTLVYHCIQDQNGKLMEICMVPYLIKPIHEGGCPWAHYYTDGKSVLGGAFYLCKGSGCPQKNDSDYWTNELYKYPRCLHNYDETTEVIKSTRSILETTINAAVEESDGNKAVIVVAAVLALTLCIVLVMMVLIWLKRKSNGTSNRMTRKYSEVEHQSKKLLPETIKVDKDGRTIVHDACFQGDIHLVKQLINTFDDLLYSKDNNGRMPIHLAGFSGSVELVQYLVGKNCDVHSKDNTGLSIVHIACSEGHINLVKFLIEVNKDVLSMEDNKGRTPLHCAGYLGSVELVQYLIDNGCDVFCKDNDGRTIVHYACSEGHINLVKLLIEVNKDVLSMEDNKGRTPFLCAGFSGSVELVQYLIGNGCDVFSKDNGGRTFAHNACREGHIDQMKFLIGLNKAVLSQKDNNGMTPFHCAGFSESVDLVQYLIDNGCDVYSTNYSGRTIVHNVFLVRHVGLIRYLVGINKNVLNIKDNNEVTPIECAGFSGPDEVEQYLQDKGG